MSPRIRAQGFTLIELMVVVAILGILASISIPLYHRFQLRARTSEGKVNLAAIAKAQEAYFAEFATYVACTGSPGTPGTPPGSARALWTDGGGFGELGYSPEGDVYFQYSVVVGGAGPFDHFTAQAISDIDDNGVINAWGYVKPSVAGIAIAGGLTGDPAVDCPATGSLDRQTDVRTFSSVGPCWTLMGQSIF